MQARNLQLDLLRTAAILAVLVEHTVIFRAPRWWWDDLAVRAGWTGVDLFFVLSGFLISGLLFSEFQKRGRINFGRFAIRRALKLYPTLYVLVFGVMFLRLFRNPFEGFGWILRPVLHDIFFVQSYLPGTYGHFWSLAVEEHFYILLPLMLYFMLRQARSGDIDPFRKLPLIFLLVGIACVGARLGNAILVQPYDSHTHLFPTHLRLDSLFFGVLLSYWYRFHFDRFSGLMKRFRRLLLSISLLLISSAFIWSGTQFFIYTFGLSCFYLGYGGLMIALLQVPLTSKGLFGQLLISLAYIGKHSYPIYVFHIMVIEILSEYGLFDRIWGTILYFVCSIAIGVLFSKIIEYPVLRLRDRMFPPLVNNSALPHEASEIVPVAAAR